MNQNKLYFPIPVSDQQGVKIVSQLLVGPVLREAIYLEQKQIKTLHHKEQGGPFKTYFFWFWLL